MSTGARLQQEREKRSISLDEMASATEIRREYLEALEGDAFDQLRGPAFGKLYIRAYAEKLGFDPAPLLEDYERAVRQHAAQRSSPKKKERLRPVQSAVARWREARITEHRTPEEVEVEPPPVLEPEHVEPEPLEAEAQPAVALEPEASMPAPPEGPSPPPSEPIEAPLIAPAPAEPSRRSTRRLVLGAIALVLGVLAIRALGRRADAPEPPVPAPVQTVAPATIERTEDVAAPEPTPAPTPSPRAAQSSGLRVTESAVGRRVGGRFVAGGEFRKGQVAAFETRVVGGRRGDQIRHVWKWGGRRMQSIVLRVSSSEWRTFSTKTLNSAGVWTVEAHDASGAVLASAEFVAGE